jgi:hypothetical protein
MGATATKDTRLKQLAHEPGSGIHGSRYETLAADLLHYLDEEKRSSSQLHLCGHV